MDKRLRVTGLLMALLLTAMSLASCKAGMVNENGTTSYTVMPTPLNTPDDTPSVSSLASTPYPIPSQTPFPFPELEKQYKGAKLYEQPVEGKLCISIVPTLYKPWPRKYYVPDDAAQKKLRELLETYREDKKYYGVIMIGDLYVKKDSELFRYAYDLVRRDCGITLMDPKDIRDIVKATMYYSNMDSEGVQIITDAKKLSLIEDRLSNATEDNASKCPYSEALLVLTRKDGKEIMVRLATDGCAMYFHDGQYFEYKGASTDILFMFKRAKWAAFQ